MATSQAPIQVRRATRQAVKLKVGIEGPAGSGKTEGLLAVLAGITNGGRVLVADSENESASYYADRYDFDTTPLDAKSTPRTVVEIINHAVREKYDALGIDSLSRVWQNLRDAKDAYDLANPNANRWATWGLRQFGPAWDGMMKHLLDAPIHIVSTMRSKMTHEQVEEDGKKKVVKLGLQAQVRDGAEYEFGLVLTVNMAHRAEATKDRTHLFEAGELVDLCDTEVHKKLIKWMNTETPASVEAVERLIQLMKHEAVGDVTRKAVQNYIAAGTPGADKVAKWTQQTQAHISAAEEKAAQQSENVSLATA